MKVIIGVIFLVFVIIFGLTELEKNRATFYSNLGGNSNTSHVATINDELISVTISGQVTNPGTYTINAGDYLNDVIEKAGGVTSDADFDCFNFYLVIEENISIYIPKESQEAKVSLNEGTENDFKSLEGIGSTIASRIVEYRTENGDFEYLEQIKNVQGIGASLFNKIKDKICL